jgi:hypothetical protein
MVMKAPVFVILRAAPEGSLAKRTTPGKEP